MAETEMGSKWWIRYVAVPLLAGGGLVALIVALTPKPVVPDLTVQPAQGGLPLTTTAIEAPPRTKIGSAIYGTGDQSRRCDATGHVSKLCEGAIMCPVFPSNAMCGDPKKGTPKHLFVTYRCGDIGKPLLDLPEGRQGIIDCRS